jgi:hypothetical protein
MNARCLMKYFVVLAVTALPVCASPAGGVAADTNAFICTISASRQFAAYAHDRLLPSALCVYAERIKHEWLWRMEMPDAWRDPIVIVVHQREPSQADAPTISLLTFQTEKHLKYQIDCLAPPPLDEAELLAAIVDGLCAEFANRDEPTKPHQAYTVPLLPLWLVQGLAASIQGRNDRLLVMARRSIAAGRPQSASGLLAARILPADPPERSLFQANSWIFTEGLMTLPGGAEKLRRFVKQIGARKSASKAFWSVYSQDFPRKLMLEKWWSLQQVSGASVGVAQNLTAEETAQQLDDILLTKLDPTNGLKGTSGKTEIVISQLWRYGDEPWLKEVVRIKLDRLGALRSQAHPFFRPVIDRYFEALSWLAQRRTVRFRRSVAKAAVERVVAEKRSKATNAYLDQAEQMYAPEELSKVFAGYFQTLDRFENLDQQRRSPISDYLDQFDRR